MGGLQKKCEGVELKLVGRHASVLTWPKICFLYSIFFLRYRECIGHNVWNERTTRLLLVGCFESWFNTLTASHSWAFLCDFSHFGESQAKLLEGFRSYWIAVVKIFSYPKCFRRCEYEIWNNFPWTSKPSLNTCLSLSRCCGTASVFCYVSFFCIIYSQIFVWAPV